jgi:hypothetical protein
VVGEPALPVPDLGEHTQARCSTLSGVCLSHKQIQITGVAVVSEGNKDQDKSEISGAGVYIGVWMLVFLNLVCTVEKSWSMSS